MSQERYLLDTHALIFWCMQIDIAPEFITFLDKKAQEGHLFVSSATFWEVALLAKKGRIEIADVSEWMQFALDRSGLRLLEATADHMIQSVALPDYHKDPFDRLLIAQAQDHGMHLVSRDQIIQQYDVLIFWM